MKLESRTYATVRLLVWFALPAVVVAVARVLLSDARFWHALTAATFVLLWLTVFVVGGILGRARREA